MYFYTGVHYNVLMCDMIFSGQRMHEDTDKDSLIREVDHGQYINIFDINQYCINGLAGVYWIMFVTPGNSTHHQVIGYFNLIQAFNK